MDEDEEELLRSLLFPKGNINASLLFGSSDDLVEDLAFGGSLEQYLGIGDDEIILQSWKFNIIQ